MKLLEKLKTMIYEEDEEDEKEEIAKKLMLKNYKRRI